VEDTVRLVWRRKRLKATTSGSELSSPDVSFQTAASSSSSSTATELYGQPTAPNRDSSAGTPLAHADNAAASSATGKLTSPRVPLAVQAAVLENLENTSPRAEASGRSLEASSVPSAVLSRTGAHTTREHKREVGGSWEEREIKETTSMSGASSPSTLASMSNPEQSVRIAMRGLRKFASSLQDPSPAATAVPVVSTAPAPSTVSTPLSVTSQNLSTVDDDSGGMQLVAVTSRGESLLRTAQSLQQQLAADVASEQVTHTPTDVTTIVSSGEETTTESKHIVSTSDTTAGDRTAEDTETDRENVEG